MNKSVAVAPTLSPSPSLTEQVTNKLRADIKRGRFPVGEAIPTEEVLGATFGVSRTVVREAISRLKADGLIRSRQGLGAFVSSTVGIHGFQIADATGLASARCILELRLGLEVEAAGLAASRRRSRHLFEMRQTLEAMEQAMLNGDLEKGADADLNFHRAICLATQNPHFLSFFDYLRPHLHKAILLSRQRSMVILKRTGDSQAEHERIFTAIEKESVEDARNAIREHITRTLNRLSLTRIKSENRTSG